MWSDDVWGVAVQRCPGGSTGVDRNRVPGGQQQARECGGHLRRLRMPAVEYRCPAVEYRCRAVEYRGNGRRARPGAGQSAEREGAGGGAARTACPAAGADADEEAAPPGPTWRRCSSSSCSTPSPGRRCTSRTWSSPAPRRARGDGCSQTACCASALTAALDDGVRTHERGRAPAGGAGSPGERRPARVGSAPVTAPRISGVALGWPACAGVRGTVRHQWPGLRRSPRDRALQWPGLRRSPRDRAPQWPGLRGSPRDHAPPVARPAQEPAEPCATVARPAQESAGPCATGRPASARVGRTTGDRCARGSGTVREWALRSGGRAGRVEDVGTNGGGRGNSKGLQRCWRPRCSGRRTVPVRKCR